VAKVDSTISGWVKKGFNNLITAVQKRFNNFTIYTKSGWIEGLRSFTTDSGEVVTVRRGTRIDTVFSCINVLAQDVAKLPYNVKQKTDKGVEISTGTIQTLVHTRPNRFTSAFNYRYDIVYKMLSWGNGYALILRDASMNPVEKTVLPSDEVEPLIIAGELWYRFRGVLIAATDMLHYKLYSFDGIVGVSPITWAAETFGLRLKMDKYRARVLGEQPAGLLTFTQDLNTEQTNQNREAWQRMNQGDALGKTPVLSGGAKYTHFGINPDDVQMIQGAELSDERITGIYRVPPTLIQDYKRATFSNAEQQNLVYLQGLTPILTVIEQEDSFKLFKESNKTATKPFFTKFNIKALLRSDIMAQIEWMRFQRQNVLMNADELRALDDLPPLPDGLGEMYLVQGAMVPMHLLEQFFLAKGTTPTQREIDIDELLKMKGEDLILNGHNK